MSSEIVLSVATTVGVIAGMAMLVALTQPAAWRRLWRGEASNVTLGRDLKIQQEMLDEQQRNVDRIHAEIGQVRVDFETMRADFESAQSELQRIRADLVATRADLEVARSELKTTHAPSPATPEDPSLAAFAPLLAAIVSGIEAQHLRLLRQGDGVAYHNHQGVQDELGSLLARGFIRKTQPGSLYELPPEFELTEQFEITSLGRTLLDARDRFDLDA